MSALPVLHYPDPRLRIKAAPVDGVDGRVSALIDDMLETMYAAPGIGLAAPQVNVSKRIIVIDISDERNDPLCLVNPEILTGEGEVQMEEGCLSVPGIYDVVTRFSKVEVRALDRSGRSAEFVAEGLQAVCIQHEIDHLDGRLFVDYLSELKRQRIRKKLDKLRRKTL